jgi:hypothetical protein
MDAYYGQIRKLENKFYGLEFHHVVQANNEAADKLLKLGSTQVEIPHGVFVHDLVKPSINDEEKPMAKQSPVDQFVALILTTGTDWRAIHQISHLCRCSPGQDRDGTPHTT